MKLFLKLFGMILVVLSGVGTATASQAAEKPKITLEIHQAETKPAPGLTEVTVEGTKQKVYLHREAALTKSDVAGASAQADNAQNPAVAIRLTKDGSKKIAQLTERHLNKPLAIILNGKVVSAPIVRDKITGEKMILSGKFTKEEAEQIARTLRSK
jgi:preprotein translocase subunit SecD